MDTTIQNTNKKAAKLDFSELQQFLTREIKADEFGAIMEDAYEMLLDRLIEDEQFTGGAVMQNIMWHFRQFVKIAKRIKPVSEG